MSVVKYWQKSTQASHLVRVRNNITIPAFDVVNGDGSLWGHARVVFEFLIQTTKRVILQYPLDPPEDCNFIPVIRLPLTSSSAGVPVRYALWDLAGVEIPLEYTLYDSQRLPISFVLEIWCKDGETSAVLSDDYVIATSSRTLRTSRDTPDPGDVAEAITQDETIYCQDFPWVLAKPTTEIDFNNAITLP